MTLPFTSLDAVSANGPGESVEVPAGSSKHTLFVWVENTSGAYSVSLEGSHDNVHWDTLGTAPSSGLLRTTGGGHLVRYVRARLDGSLTAGTVTATILSEPGSQSFAGFTGTFT